MSTPTTPELSAVTQDYLKVVWSAREWSTQPVTTKMLATRLGVGPSTVSETVRRLADSGLVTHEPYGAVELTADGERHALAVVRRHRLIETFLVEVLGYGWDEVHDEAEVLEHAVSDLFVERISAQLGHPRRDPHGDPIPAPDGAIEAPPATLLWDTTPGGVGGRADLRRRPRAAAVRRDRRPGARRPVTVVERRTVAGVISVRVGPAAADDGRPRRGRRPGDLAGPGRLT